ncbi:MAG: type II toxin-antitoxin system HicA family toxin [Planctomycetaceae bacterium]
MSTTVRDLVRTLEADGWVQVRQRGNHRQFRHPRKSGTVTVAGKPSSDVPQGTLNSVLKQAGLRDTEAQDPDRGESTS